MRKRKKQQRRFEISKDPEICERVFADYRLQTLTFLVEGNVFEYIGEAHYLKGQRCVIVSRKGMMLAADGISVSWYKRKFILFENGLRSTNLLDFLEDIRLIGVVGASTALAWDSKIKDPTTPSKYKPHLIKIVV